MSTTEPQALWITAPGSCELRDAACQPGPDELVVETLYSGISRGTERLVFGGHVPETEHATMRAPFQEGEFTFPVKYGYAAVGRVLNGDGAGEVVFVLHPHQTRFAVPSTMAMTVPDAVPATRAILAANMETALNTIWDSGISAGDRVVIVGCGVVGALAGYLAARMPGTDVTLVDVQRSRAPLARQLGCAFATPDTAPGDADVVIHTSASEAGLALAIALAGLEAKIIEASWFGTSRPAVSLGGRFHQRRLQIIGSQVGRLPAKRAARWTLTRRLTKAISLLSDDRLDGLVTSASEFSELPADYAGILANPETLCHRVTYGV